MEVESSKSVQKIYTLSRQLSDEIEQFNGQELDEINLSAYAPEIKLGFLKKRLGFKKATSQSSWARWQEYWGRPQPFSVKNNLRVLELHPSNLQRNPQKTKIILRTEYQIIIDALRHFALAKSNGDFLASRMSPFHTDYQPSEASSPDLPFDIQGIFSVTGHPGLGEDD
jgi:hypothetical protein